MALIKDLSDVPNYITRPLADNWTIAYNKRPVSLIISGNTIKTISLALGDNTTLSADVNFTGVFNNFTTGVFWDSSTGDLTTKRNGLGDLTTNLDGRYSLTGHTHTFASLTAKPTTLSGYGITDAQPQLNGNGFLIMSGNTVTYNNSVLTSIVGTNNRIIITGTNQIDISGSYVGQISLSTLGTITTGTWSGSSISTNYTDAKIKTVTGTANRLTITGTATDPIFNISTTYVGQNTITTLGTITTGTWSGLFGAVSAANLTNITAANISAGTAGINITGNAGTATLAANSTLWNGQTYDGTNLGSGFDALLVHQTSTNTYRPANITAIQIWLGITSLAYLPLSGGTLTGALNGTTANFSGTVIAPIFSGNATTATNANNATTWNGQSYDGGSSTSPAYFMVQESTGGWKYSTISQVKTALGVTSLAYLPLSGGTLTGGLVGTTATFTSTFTASAFITSGGASTQFVKGDGSLDSTSYTTTARSLNINGSSQTLAADRTWTITTTGTANKIDVSGGAGLTPTITISPSYIGQTSLTTLGTIGTGVWQGTSISTTYTDAKVASIGGTTNRITIGGTSTAPTVDVSTSYVGQNTITTLGTVSTGVWSGTPISFAYIGRVLETARTISITGDLSYTSNGFDGTGNVTGSGILATVNSNVGTFGSSTSIPTFTVNAKGLITSVSGNVVIAPASTLTGSVLASNILTSSLTTVGTITSGTWTASVIGSNYGGAGAISGLLKANGSGVVSSAVIGTDYVTASSTNIFTNKSGNISQWTNDSAYLTSASVGNGTLTLNTTGVGLSGSQTFTANQSGAATFTVTSNATSSNVGSTIVARDGSGNFTAGTMTGNITGTAASETLSTVTSRGASTSTFTTFTGGARTYDALYLDNNYGNTLVGLYSSGAYQGIYAMGNAYRLPADGSTTGTLYGLAWSYPHGGQSTNLASHGILLMINGVTQAALSSNLWLNGGTITGAGNIYSNGVQVVYNSGTWGISITGNAGTATLASNSNYAYSLWTQSHPNVYQFNVNWDGTYWQATVNHTAPINVGHATDATNSTNATYGRYSYNNGAYSGSGWVEPSDLGVRYANGAGYASSAGNADTVDGYHASNFIGKNGTSYYQPDTWINWSGGITAGLYWSGLPTTPTYAEIYPVTSSHGGIGVLGMVSSYTGIRMDSASPAPVIGMFDGSGNGGTWDSTSGWHYYWLQSQSSLALGGSQTYSGWKVVTNGNHYVMGQIYATSTIQGSEVYRGSARHLKEDFKTWEDRFGKTTATDLLRGVKIWDYALKSDENKLRKLSFIADDTHEAFATVNHDVMDQGSSIAVLIKGSQETDDRVSKLENIIKELERKVEMLMNL
jgi:hypothetical protein